MEDAEIEPYWMNSQKIKEKIKKNPAKQDSPPAAGRASDILPFRRSAIRAERLFIVFIV